MLSQNMKFPLPILLLCALTFSGTSQTITDDEQPAREIVIVPGAHYRASGIHKLLFGTGHRAAWTTPIQVPILDLQRFAGGLTPIKKGGGLQTHSLRFKGADGKEYDFRSVDKDPGKALPEELQGTIVEELGKDHISTLLPGGALVTSRLAEAVEVLNVKPQFAVMPDDERLGEFRSDFAGVLGTIEERPDDGPDGAAGFAGSKKIVSSDTFYDKLDSGYDNQIDEISYLRARLLDMLIGDWDRHADQWRWARFKEGDKKIWRPIARDRDFAFVVYDGFFPSLLDKRWAKRHIDGFNKSDPDAVSLSHKSRYLDGRLLNRLSWTDWQPVIAEFTDRLNDQVLQKAIDALPREFHDTVGKELLSKLQQRREGLAALARSYYFHLAKAVDIQTTDESERVLIERLPEGDVTVEIYASSPITNSPDAPVYARTFHRRETDEIRVYTLGGNDHVTVTGEAPASIRVRVIGGDGDDTLVDQSKVHGYLWDVLPISDAEKETFFYDDSPATEIEAGPSTRTSFAVSSAVHQRPPIGHTVPAGAGELKKRNTPPELDHGTIWKPLPFFGLDADNGLFLGGGARFTTYGFRKTPYAHEIAIAGNYAFRTSAFNLDFHGSFFDVIPDIQLKIDASTSVPEGKPKYYGFGNDSRRDAEREDDFYRARNNNISIVTQLVLPLSPAIQLRTGVDFLHLSTDLQEISLVQQERPFGVEIDEVLGITGGLRIDTRDIAVAPYHGIFIDGAFALYPGLLDNDDSYTRFHMNLAGFYSPSNALTLAARATGERVKGDFPYYHAAYIGGAPTLRGYNNQRFAGDTALSGSLEARFKLGRLTFVFPGDIGLIAFTDAGRVWLDSDSPGGWHTSTGGGFYWAPVYRHFTISVTGASSVDGLFINAGLGFAY